MSDGSGGATPTFGLVNGRYALEEIVGSGGMGVVYRGFDQVLGRTVAVKMIRQELAGEEFIRRFEREAAILARLRSPYIVVVYDYGKHDDQFFMVTDFLTEGDLAGWLERNGTMPVEDAVALMAKLAEGLADAHELGVLHRDIKPANTLLWSRGSRLRPVLADFGIAVTSDLTLTKTGAVVGSPLYMAPERHMGEPATVASDIYSMGCLLYAVLTGQPPYWGGTEFQAANAHLNDPIPTVPAELPHAAEVDAVLADCLAKQPADRVPSAEALADRLKALAERMSPANLVAEPPTPTGAAGAAGAAGGDRGGRPPTGATTVLSPTDAPPSPTPEQRPEQESRRWRAPVLAAVVAVVTVLALAGGLGWWLVGGDDEDPSAAPPVSTSDGPSESVSEGPPPEAPGMVKATAASGDLEVRFDAQVPAPSDDVTYRLERRDNGWRPTRASFTITTPVGGVARCAVLRVVAVNEVGETPGRSRRVCEESRPPRIALIPNPTTCAYAPPYSDIPCRWYDVEFTGFAADEQLEFTIQHNLSGDSLQQRFSTDANGHFFYGARTDSLGSHKGGFQAPAAVTWIKVTADGTTETFEGSELD